MGEREKTRKAIIWNVWRLSLSSFIYPFECRLSISNSPVRDKPAMYMGMAMSHQDQEALNIKLGDLNLLYEDCEWLVGTYHVPGIETI